MRNKLKQVKWVKLDPNSDVVVALLTLVWLTAAFYTMNRTMSLAFILTPTHSSTPPHSDADTGEE